MPAETRYPKNVTALIAWFETHNPGVATMVADLFAVNAPGSNVEALASLMLMAFECGREFEQRHPDVISGLGYLPEYSDATIQSVP